MNETAKPDTGLSPVERHRHSEEARIGRVSALIAQGYTLTAICRKPSQPNIETLRRWFAENEQLRDAYEQARDLRNEQLADDAVALADTDTSNKGLKLRIDARKWRVALKPKDEKEPDKKAEARETLERLQRALERVRKREEEEIRQRYAAEDNADKEPSDGGEIGDFSFKSE